MVCGFFAVCLSTMYLLHPFFMWCLLLHSVHSRCSRRSAATGHLSRQWLVSVPGMSKRVLGEDHEPLAGTRCRWGPLAFQGAVAGFVASATDDDRVGHNGGDGKGR